MVAEAKQVYDIRCVHCGATVSVRAYPSDIVEWENGKYIQDAMGYLSPAEREMFISSTCDDCWKNIFDGLEE